MSTTSLPPPPPQRCLLCVFFLPSAEFRERSPGLLIVGRCVGPEGLAGCGLEILGDTGRETEVMKPEQTERMPPGGLWRSDSAIFWCEGKRGIEEIEKEKEKDRGRERKKTREIGKRDVSLLSVHSLALRHPCVLSGALQLICKD